MPYTDWKEVPVVLTPAQAADLLCYNRGTVYRWIKRGELATVSTPSGPRVAREALMHLCGVRPEHACLEVDPEVIHHLERAQYHHNEAMRLLEVK